MLVESKAFNIPNYEDQNALPQNMALWYTEYRHTSEILWIGFQTTAIKQVVILRLLKVVKNTASVMCNKMRNACILSSRSLRNSRCRKDSVTFPSPPKAVHKVLS